MPVVLKKTIGLRLLRYVFGCYFAVTVIVTSAQLLSEYFHVKKNVFIELSNLGETLESSLARSIWNYNDEQVESTLLGTSKISMVSGAKVTDIDNKLIATNGITSDNKNSIAITKQEGKFGNGVIHEINYLEKQEAKTLFEYRFPIYYSEGNNEDKQLVGYCYIYATHGSVIDRVQYGFILIIVNSLIKTLALWLIFLFFTKRIIAEPLGELTQATQKLDPDNPETFRNNYDLDKIFHSNNDDELQHLADSFLHMRNAVVDKIDFIEQQNLHLEQRVKERTHTIEEVNRELKYLSLHDPLTGLPNRTLFHDRLENLIKSAKRENFSFAVASIDLCKFKDINDTFGHQAGDIVLQALSKRIQNTIYSTDTISRMGGDEFAILLKGVDKDAVNKVGKKIIACAYEPIHFNQESILAGINVGFSIYPEHGDNADLLFKHADMAMYQAKRDEHGLSLFTPEVSRQLQRRDVITQDLEKAIDNDQLSVFYQPIIQGKTRQVNGVEALLRWYHPSLGFIPPDEFIPIAERSNIIKTITEWVIHQTLADGEKFQRQGYDLKISINLSGRLMSDSTFPKRFEGIFKDYDFPKKNITLELTESSAMKNPEKALISLNKLKNLGVQLSIDDFGTGYSSFSYLTRLPVNELKIDRSFLSDLNENNRVVIESIIALAHRLNLRVVAEGVETEEILETIEHLGSDYIQGYYFSRPIPADELFIWLSTYNQQNHSSSKTENRDWT